MTGIFSQINLLGNALNGAQQNHRVISSNVANVNTPNYKAKQLDFKELMSHLDSREGGRTTLGDVDLQLVEGLAERMDGNNVDMEKELSALKKNAMAYQAYTQLMSSKLQVMRQSITRR
ncbi:MAG: flagellar basal body rod protein FlgB [Pirellulaceae bacterium]